MRRWWLHLCGMSRFLYVLAAVELVASVALATLGAWLGMVDALIFAALIATCAHNQQTIADLRASLRDWRSLAIDSIRGQHR